MRVVLSIWIVCLFALSCKAAVKVELIFDHVELLNGSFVEGIYNYSIHRITKFNRTTYVFNTEFETFVEFNNKENYEIEAIFFYNRLNNNQYTKSMIGVPKSNLCDALDKYKHLIFTPTNKNNHNFPGPNVPFCPFSTVNFYY